MEESHGRETGQAREGRISRQDTQQAGHASSRYPASVQDGRVGDGEQYRESRNPSTGDRRAGKEFAPGSAPRDGGARHEGGEVSRGGRDEHWREK